MRLLAGIGVLMSGMCGLGERTAAVEFAPAKTYTVGTEPVTVVAGDFNGDGREDLAVLNRGSGNVSILLANGDGTFQPAMNFDVGIASPASIFAADFNGDGKQDLAVFAAGDATNNVAGAVSVLLGNGNGTFQSGEVTNLTIYTTQIGVADFNGDNKGDLVMSEFNDTFTLSLLTGNGDGTFQAARPLGSPVACTGGMPLTGCRLFAAADFNRDGKTDLVVAGPEGLHVLLGNGDGTFRNGVTVPLAEGYAVGAISTADLNGDGTADLIGTSMLSNCGSSHCMETIHYSVILGNGDGSFRAEQIFNIGSFTRNEFGFGGYDTIGNIIAADFNGDGILDILDFRTVKTSSFPGSPVSVTMEVRLGRGDGTFAPLMAFPAPGNSVIAFDLNGDKLADLVAIRTSNAVDVLLNDSPTSGADLVLTQTGASPEPVGVGQNLTYSAVVLNEGPENATGVKLSDALPSGVTFVSATSTIGTCIAANQTVTCDIGALPKTASAQVAIVVTPTAVGTIENMLKVAGNETDGNIENNSASESSTVGAVYALTVAKAGTGTGTVTANPGVRSGINCGSVCTEKYLVGTHVSLNVSPDASSTFDGWSGACAGDACNVTMDGDKTVTATFGLTPDFTVSPTAANLMMTRGGQRSEQINFPAQGGFTGMIAVTCSVSGAAPMPTCAVSPASVAAGGSVQLAVNATELSALRTLPRVAFGAVYAVCLPLWIAGCLLGSGFDKKRAQKWLGCMLVLVVSILPVACARGGGAKPVVQSYVVTVMAQSGAISHAVSVHVTLD
jgi:uncharacterized repeat protein (TIGR01451 family)